MQQLYNSVLPLLFGARCLPRKSKARWKVIFCKMNECIFVVFPKHRKYEQIKILKFNKIRPEERRMWARQRFERNSANRSLLRFPRCIRFKGNYKQGNITQKIWIMLRRFVTTLNSKECFFFVNKNGKHLKNKQNISCFQFIWKYAFDGTQVRGRYPISMAFYVKMASLLGNVFGSVSSILLFACFS